MRKLKKANEPLYSRIKRLGFAAYVKRSLKKGMSAKRVKDILKRAFAKVYENECERLHAISLMKPVVDHFARRYQKPRKVVLNKRQKKIKEFLLQM